MDFDLNVEPDPYMQEDGQDALSNIQAIVQIMEEGMICSTTNFLEEVTQPKMTIDTTLNTTVTPHLRVQLPPHPHQIL